MMKCLGLMDFIPLHEMISLLIKLNPLLSKMQRLQSHFVIFNLIELYGQYESYENYAEFSQQINLYCSTCPNEDEDIAEFLQKYEKWTQRLRTNPPDSIFAKMKPILGYANGSKENILDIIAEYVEENSTKRRKSSVCFIAREFNRINAQFYQGVLFKEFRLECWKNKDKNQSSALDEDKNQLSSLTEYSNLFNLITQFIKYLIYSYPPFSRKQAHVMTLLILIARESLHYQYGPDLTTVMAVVTIFQGPEIKKRALALLDKNTLKILDDLTTLMSPSNEFKNYRGFLAAEPRALPFLGVIFHDKTPLYEYPEMLYKSLARLGGIYQSLLSIKKELTDVQLDSQSDLVEQIQLKRVPQKEAEEVKEVKEVKKVKWVKETKEVKVVEPKVELNKDIRRKSIPAAPQNYKVSFFDLPPEEDAGLPSELSNIFDY